jgi:hypothetical protein
VVSRALSPLVRFAAAAWVAAAAYVFVVEGVLDAQHLWAPYLGIVLWTPIWLIGALGLLLLIRGASRSAERRWSLAATVVGGIPAMVVLMDLGKMSGFRFDGLMAIPLTVLSLAALATAIRAKG